MNRRIRNLWIKGLCGSGEAYRRLGVILLTGRGCRKDCRMARLCLKQSTEMGNERDICYTIDCFRRGGR